MAIKQNVFEHLFFSLSDASSAGVVFIDKYLNEIRSKTRSELKIKKTAKVWFILSLLMNFVYPFMVLRFFFFRSVVDSVCCKIDILVLKPNVCLPKFADIHILYV
uniref:Uncharacterized protein n=1 Tax=Cacopsylla melanoneura TaxID=428564 RepID=A0A8D9F2T3_9HEMI